MVSKYSSEKIMFILKYLWMKLYNAWDFLQNNPGVGVRIGNEINNCWSWMKDLW
jgi:hypothetical protein